MVSGENRGPSIEVFGCSHGPIITLADLHLILIWLKSILFRESSEPRRRMQLRMGQLLRRFDFGR